MGRKSEGDGWWMDTDTGCRTRSDEHGWGVDNGIVPVTSVSGPPDFLQLATPFLKFPFFFPHSSAQWRKLNSNDLSTCLACLRRFTPKFEKREPYLNVARARGGYRDDRYQKFYAAQIHGLRETPLISGLVDAESINRFTLFQSSAPIITALLL
jgi:hypothetical protein